MGEMEWMVKKETNSRKTKKKRQNGLMFFERTRRQRKRERTVRDGETEATVVCCQFNG